MIIVTEYILIPGMDTIYLVESNWIAYIQNLLGGFNSFLLAVSRYSDPSYAISILFPVAASLNTTIAAQLLVTSVVAGWLNTIFKGLLMEDRPYWWVSEKRDQLGAPMLAQTAITCECGPGSPSGHVMGTVALLYLATKLIKIHLAVMQKFLTFFVLLITFIVSLSRVYIAAHFPHQCILGALLGWLVGMFMVGEYVWSVHHWWRQASCRNIFLVTVIMVSVPLCLNALQTAWGFDPQWTVRAAFKWCVRTDYIKVSKTPMYAVVRYCSCALGLALVSPLDSRSYAFSPFVGVFLVSLSVSCLHILMDLVHTHNAASFYILKGTFYTTLVFLVLCVVPAIASCLVKRVKRN